MEKKKRERHVDPIYYTAQDVMEILQYSRATAYNCIKQLNNELEEKGYLVRPGLVPKRYFSERYGWEV